MEPWPKLQATADVTMYFRLGQHKGFQQKES